MAVKVVNTGATMTHRPPIQVGSFNAMRLFGGGFDKALCEAIVKADLENQRLLAQVFPDHVTAYLNPDGWDAKPGCCPKCGAHYTPLRPRIAAVQPCCQLCTVYDR